MRSRYTFGPFEIDEGARRMARGGEPFGLPDRQLDIDAAWKDVAVGDNSLEQAISALRRTLGAHRTDGPGHEITVRVSGRRYEVTARRGYER